MATPSLLLIPDRYKSGVLYSQLPESGAGDIDFTRASAATRVNASGLIESVASGVPRLDYTGGGCPSLLLEPQRTNLVTWSEDFTNADWNKVDSSVSGNVAISPDGTTNADKLIENNQNAAHYVESNSGTIVAGTHTMSVFAKAGERNILQLLFNGSANVDAVANFNLTAGTISFSAFCTATIENYGNGWYRCSITATLVASTVPLAYYVVQTSPTAIRADAYLGDGTSGLFIWGAQFE